MAQNAGNEFRRPENTSRDNNNRGYNNYGQNRGNDSNHQYRRDYQNSENHGNYQNYQNFENDSNYSNFNTEQDSWHDNRQMHNTNETTGDVRRRGFPPNGSVSGSGRGSRFRPALLNQRGYQGYQRGNYGYRDREYHQHLGYHGNYGYNRNQFHQGYQGQRRYDMNDRYDRNNRNNRNNRHNRFGRNPRWSNNNIENRGNDEHYEYTEEDGQYFAAISRMWNSWANHPNLGREYPYRESTMDLSHHIGKCDPRMFTNNTRNNFPIFDRQIKFQMWYKGNIPEIADNIEKFYCQYFTYKCHIPNYVTITKFDNGHDNEADGSTWETSMARYKFDAINFFNFMYLMSSYDCGVEIPSDTHWKLAKFMVLKDIIDSFFQTIYYAKCDSLFNFDIFTNAGVNERANANVNINNAKHNNNNNNDNNNSKDTANNDKSNGVTNGSNQYSTQTDNKVNGESDDDDGDDENIDLKEMDKINEIISNLPNLNDIFVKFGFKNEINLLSMFKEYLQSPEGVENQSNARYRSRNLSQFEKHLKTISNLIINSEYVISNHYPWFVKKLTDKNVHNLSDDITQTYLFCDKLAQTVDVMFQVGFSIDHPLIDGQETNRNLETETKSDHDGNNTDNNSNDTQDTQDNEDNKDSKQNKNPKNAIENNNKQNACTDSKDNSGGNQSCAERKNRNNTAMKPPENSDGLGDIMQRLNQLQLNDSVNVNVNMNISGSQQPSQTIASGTGGSNDAPNDAPNDGTSTDAGETKRDQDGEPGEGGEQESQDGTTSDGDDCDTNAGRNDNYENGYVLGKYGYYNVDPLTFVGAPSKVFANNWDYIKMFAQLSYLVKQKQQKQQKQKQECKNEIPAPQTMNNHNDYNNDSDYYCNNTKGGGGTPNGIMNDPDVDMVELARETKKRLATYIDDQIDLIDEQLNEVIRLIPSMDERMFWWKIVSHPNRYLKNLQAKRPALRSRGGYYQNQWLRKGEHSPAVLPRLYKSFKEAYKAINLPHLNPIV